MRYVVVERPERDVKHNRYDVIRDGRWFASRGTREEADECIRTQQGYDQYDLDNALADIMVRDLRRQGR